ncbi:MAG: hypothetical protein Q8P55_00230, partial [bacterium]|nr:hypothetical protein [bacterium]
LPAQAGWQTFFPKPGAIRYLAKPHLMLPKGVKSLASKFNLEFPRLRQGFGGQAWMRNPSAARKRLILILLFCFLLFLGYVLF